MSWQIQLKESVESIQDVAQAIVISSREKTRLKKVVEHHPMRVPPYYLSLIDPCDPDDPVRAMAVPSVDELNLMGSYDTSGEKDNTRMPGLQHKYSQTAVIISTNRCAMYCRHCFRKRLVGLPNDELLRRFDDAASYIRQHSEINNVLVSGGDPFVLSTSLIARFLEMLSDIRHLSFIRFGSRIPVTLPHRIIDDTDFLQLLRRHSRADRRLFVVTQFNHPREITDEAVAAIDCLLRAGVVVNNQSVLLRRVNDNPESLAALQNGLVRIGVNPYYVFQCRPVKRVKHHFQVPLHQAYEIVEEAKRMLNGHSKRFRLVMSHKKGKIEIVGKKGDEMFFKFHQAKDPANSGKFFSRMVHPQEGWLHDNEESFSRAG
ncbi:MAG TPA: KamA family radical SAM protein [Deltaproteobacteria bacterium]|nr:KamA family radical SAM protein [Deltaproteobacteria bacterium]HQI01397.1 KamA family radical SAM protein [Deltaproteobacteria bacterium]